MQQRSGGKHQGPRMHACGPMAARAALRAVGCERGQRGGLASGHLLRSGRPRCGARGGGGGRQGGQVRGGVQAASGLCWRQAAAHGTRVGTALGCPCRPPFPEATRAQMQRSLHRHLVHLGGVVLLNVAQDLDVVVLHKVDGHALRAGRRKGCGREERDRVVSGGRRAGPRGCRRRRCPPAAAAAAVTAAPPSPFFPLASSTSTQLPVPSQHSCQFHLNTAESRLALRPKRPERPMRWM